MERRLPFDDVAWEKSDDIEESWVDFLFAGDVYNDIGQFLVKHISPQKCAEFKHLDNGGFNTSFLMTFTDTDTGGAVLRLPIVGAIMFPEEKIRNEVSVM
ncbi:hypothetical protein N7462_005447 [Penicillium macrosclerotiorum]|uniref:uncharacterized protein n=1 Tax=Penicillium macrosclerotiorum TaxID=303699 RepID=UPI002548B6AD|nr:uncharacterized protein N7462_005447 [Penicillium macrosclerotiorum]KAJ5682282.1 hypothetical protein N7462_005447 [Penicillium macrosclerotiorum]